MTKLFPTSSEIITDPKVTKLFDKALWEDLQYDAVFGLLAYFSA